MQNVSVNYTSTNKEHVFIKNTTSAVAVFLLSFIDIDVIRCFAFELKKIQIFFVFRYEQYINFVLN